MVEGGEVGVGGGVGDESKFIPFKVDVDSFSIGRANTF